MSAVVAMVQQWDAAMHFPREIFEVGLLSLFLVLATDCVIVLQRL